MEKNTNKTIGATVAAQENASQNATATAAEVAAMQNKIDEQARKIAEQARRIAYLEDIKKRSEETDALINYDYRQAVTHDVVEYLTENYSRAELEEKTQTEKERNEFEQEMHDTLWVEDSVTGNASGSYWVSTYKAALSTALNMDLFAEACQEFGEMEPEKTNAETIDITIRCYLLGECIAAAIDDIMQSDFDF